MGTAASHTGSSKDWDDVADDSDLSNWLDSLPNADETSHETETTPDDGHPSDSGDEAMPPPLPGQTLARLARALRSRSDGPGSGGGAGLGAQPGTGGRGTGGGSTTGGASLARAGGRTTAGLSAYGRRDETALGELGLSLSDLDALDDAWDRAVAIADAAVGNNPSGVDDEDARWASVQTATWALGMDSPPETREIIERFVADYVYRKASYEIGDSLRGSSADGADSFMSEKSLRAGIRICVHSEIEADFSAASIADLTELVARVYEHTLAVWGQP